MLLHINAVLKIHDKPLLLRRETNRKHFLYHTKGSLRLILRRNERLVSAMRFSSSLSSSSLSSSSSSSREQKLMGRCSRKWEFILEEKSDGKILPHSSSSSSSSSSDEKDDGFRAAAPEKAKVVVPLAYRTPTRRFRGLLCVGRSEENEERGDAAEAASRRRGKRRRRKRRTTAASKSSSSSSVVFSADRGDDDESDDESDDGENDEMYHYQNRRESTNLAAVVEKYKTFLESKNMRIPRWLFQ